MENNNVDTIVEQELPVQKSEKKSLFDKLDKAKKKENSFGDKIDGFLSKLGKGFYKVRCVCCFTSLLTTIGWIMAFSTGNIANNSNNDVAAFVGLVGIVFALIGILSALLACPGKLLGLWFSLVAGGFMIGLAFLGIGCVIGLCIGLAIGGIIVLYFPAIITIRYYFTELRYKCPD